MLMQWNINFGLWRRLCVGLAALVVALSIIVPPASAEQAPPAKLEGVSADELQRLVDTLENDRDRTRLVRQLRALIAAERGIEQPQEQPKPGFFGALSSELDAISGEILATAGAVVDAPRLIGWVQEQAGDAVARARWLEVLEHLTLIFGLAVLAELLVRGLLTRPRRALAAWVPGHPAARLALTFLGIVVDLLPLAAFAAVAYTVLPVARPRV